MDVLDAGVFVSKWEAAVPREARLVLWGPLQAKEMGLDGWEIQDGGETGFVVHNPGIKLTMGRATSTLIFVRRLGRAFLTVYFGGYPVDVPQAQRQLDMHKVVSACEMFLSRLAKNPVAFELQGEMALVDNVNDAIQASPATPAMPSAFAGSAAPGLAEASKGAQHAFSSPPAQAIHASNVDADTLPRGAIVDGEPVPRRVDRGGAEIWEV